MEKFMLKAHELQAQGFTQKQIAEQLGKTDRTIRTWLKQMPRNKGQSSIVREFITKIRKEEAQKATIRFETEPARQAQVDWIEFGRQYVSTLNKCFDQNKLYPL